MRTQQAVEQAQDILNEGCMADSVQEMLVALVASVEQFDNTVRPQVADDAGIVEMARAIYARGSDDDVEVDDNAIVSRLYGNEDEPQLHGAWVQAWVWVRPEQLDRVAT